MSEKDKTQVGPGLYSPMLPGASTPKPNPLPTLPALGGTLFDKINKSLQDKGINTPSVEALAAPSLMERITKDPAKISLIGKMLKARGKSVSASKEAIQNLFLTEPELASIAAKAGDDYNSLVSLLAEDFLPEFGKQPKQSFEGPSRNIYKYTDDDIDAFVKNIYQEKLMRPPSDEELKMERKKVKPQLEVGTVSTTKLQKNAKGVMEQVTVQQAGPTKEAVALTVEDRLKEANPDDIDRTGRINFNSWLSKNVAGA